MNTTMERLLSSVEISERGPGTILRDFQTLLEFVGVDGVKTSGKHSFLPMACLKELDGQMTRPVRPALQRPQQRSYPNINGLYLLLRATALGQVDGSGAKGRLYVDQEVLLQWQQLNPTERYFNLLEAWLIFASGEIWGEGAGGWNSSYFGHVCRLAGRFSSSYPAEADFRHYTVDQQAHLALLQMFGLVDLERQVPAPGENWHIVSVRLTDLGVGILELYQDLLFSAEVVEIERNTNSFGVLQPYFGRHFPAWKNNLASLDAEFRDGVYQFKISLDRIWRRLVMPASCDLEDLAYAILDAYEFDTDHLYCFTLRNRCGSTLSVEHPACDAQVFADEMAIGMAPIQVEETIQFLYDFGDEWPFAVKLERIDSPDPEFDEPRLIESRGESPRQYDWDDDEEEDD